MPDMTNATLIAVTGYGQERDRQKSKVAGFDHHLVKPVDIRQLLSLIAQKGPVRSPGSFSASAPRD
jgi:CheY-like chemotaxis protein